MSDVAGAVDNGGADTGAAAVQTQNLLDGGAPDSSSANGADAGNNAPANGENVANQNGAEAAPNGQTGDNPPAVEKDWRHEFADGLADTDREAWLNESARADSKKGLAERFLELRRFQSKAIVIPGEDDPERETKMGDIYTKLGRPETADKYEFKWDGPELSEAETNAVEEFKTVHHRNGGTQKQLDEYAKWDAAQRKVIQEAQVAKAEDLEQERRSELRGVWGQDYEQNEKAYALTVNHYMGEKTEEYSKLRLDDGTLVSNHPILARAFAKVGRERANDDFDYTPMNSERKQDAQGRLTALQDEMKSQGLRPGMPGYKAEEFERLYREVGSTRRRSPNDKFKRR